MKITQNPAYECSQCGATADTPKECHGKPMTESKDKFITHTTLNATEKKAADALAAKQKIAEAANKVKQENDKLYREIGEKVQTKLGKQTAGIATTEEDKEIEELKTKLL